MDGSAGDRLAASRLRGITYNVGLPEITHALVQQRCGELKHAHRLKRQAACYAAFRASGRGVFRGIGVA